MARQTFGGRPGDFTIVDPATTSNIVTAAPSLTGGTVWSAKTGGTQYTDLLVGGSPVTTVTTDTHGAVVAFQGPNNIAVVWVSFGGGTRVLLDAQGPFVLNSDAVGLSAVTPAVPAYGGFAGTANDAPRSDHAHGLETQRPLVVGEASGVVLPMNASSAGVALTVNSMQLSPVWISRPDRAPLVCSVIGVNVTTLGASSTIRFGLYKSVAATGLPDLSQLLFQSGAISAASTGMKTFAYTTAIPEGLYWAAAVAQTATCTITQSAHGMIVFTSAGGPTANHTMMSLTGVSGALPTTGTPVVNGDTAPQLFFTVA